METLILITGLAALVMTVLICVCIRGLGKQLREKDSGVAELQKQVELLSHDLDEKNRLIAEQSFRMNESVISQIGLLGSNLREDQKLRQEISTEALSRIEKEMKGLRTENQESLERIRRSNSESMDRLREDNRSSLDKINSTVNEKLQKTLDDRISKSFESVSKRLAEVYEGLGEMKNVASGVADLKAVLSNVKTRGIMGEIQLGAILAEILPAEQYGEQIGIKPNSTERVDFAVKLPGNGSEPIWLPIDSKFPGDSYSNLTDAYNSGSPEEIKSRRSTLEAEIKRCAKSIRDKYIAPPHTTDFAVMFLPFEGLYAEVVNMGLVEVLQRDFRVNIAGPSTMAAMLNSLQMGFRTLAIQKKSGEVWKILEEAKKEFLTFETVLNSTRNRLRQADEELEKLIGTRTRAINRKLSDVSLPDGGNE